MTHGLYARYDNFTLSIMMEGMKDLYFQKYLYNTYMLNGAINFI